MTIREGVRLDHLRQFFFVTSRRRTRALHPLFAYVFAPLAPQGVWIKLLPMDSGGETRD